jgi:hypothetical protein
MTTPEQFNPDESNSHSFKDARDIESPNQQLVREAFEETEAANRITLNSFDPNSPDIRADIGLVTYFPEAEAIEPQIAESKRLVMLRGLGLEFQNLEGGHPDLIFQYKYRDGEVDQIRLLTRSDGVKVPVFTALGTDEENNPIERIRLLSYAQAEDFAGQLENNLDEHKLNARLKDEIGLDETVINLAHLSFEDKRSMLAAYDEIQNLDVIKPDTGALDHVRKKLVKTMLPGSKFMSLLRDNRLTKAQTAYENSMSGLVEHCGFDAKATKEFIQSERLHRLQSLNEQLRFRRRVAKMGLVAMSSLVTIVGTGTGAASGAVMAIESSNDTATGAAIGALVGGGSGLWIAIEKGIHARKRNRLISGFSTDYFSTSGELDRQLRAEQKLANDYITLLNY